MIATTQVLLGNAGASFGMIASAIAPDVTVATNLVISLRVLSGASSLYIYQQVAFVRAYFHFCS